MKRQTGVALLPPLLVNVQKVVADIQFRPEESFTGLEASKTARVHGDTLVDSLDVSYLVQLLHEDIAGSAEQRRTRRYR